MYFKISSIMDEFINIVSEKYNIDKTDLNDLWKSVQETKQETPSMEKLSTLTVAELRGICRDRGIKCSGKKVELITRICKGDEEPRQDKTPVKPKNKKVADAPVLSTLKQPSIQINKNSFGNHEHVESKLVFNKDKKVYGRQNEDGSMESVNEEIIELCNKYKFQYVLPENLNVDDGMEEVVVDDDSDIESIEVLEDDEEEELIDYEE